MSTKISNLPRILSVDNTGLLVIALNGQTVSITQENYIKQFGTTGSIVQEGDPTATPVLDVQGSVNNIRNLEDGSGVKSSGSAQNGITLAHNFTVDSVGSPLMLNKTALSPTFPSLIGSATIAVEHIGNQIKFELTGTPASTKTVIVNQMSDFPAAVSGAITLADNTDYFVTNDLTTSDRFVYGLNSQLRAAGSVIVTISYTGSGVMFTGVDVNFRTKFITLEANSGTLLNITSTTAAGIGTIVFDACVLAADIGGSIHCNIAQFGPNLFNLITDGFTAGGTSMNALNFDGGIWIQAAGTGIDLGTTLFESAESKGFVLILSSGVTYFSGLANSGNILPGGQGTVSDCRFSATGTPLANIDPDDSRWEFFDNNRIRDTIRDGLCSVQANATETVIAGAGTFVKVAGTFIVGRGSGMTPDTTGAITYDLSKDAVIPCEASLTVQMASGGAKTVTACMALNGTPIANSCMSVSASSTVPGVLPILWQHDLSATNVMTVMIANQTDTTNVIVPSMIFRVN